MSVKAIMPYNDYESLCDAIREKTGVDEGILSSELTEKVEEVFLKGKQAEENEFWDKFQKNGTLTEYKFAFACGRFDEIFYPKYDIRIGIQTFNEFRGRIDLKERLKECNINQNGPIKVDNAYWCLASSCISRVPPLDLTNAANAVNGMFSWSEIETVDEIITNENKVFSQDCFRGCTKLKNIKFTGTLYGELDFHYATLLTHESLMSILNALKSLSGESKTLNLGTVNLNKLTDTEKAIAIDKGWILV